MNGHDRYAYRVIWSSEDEMYVGLCAEFGLLSHLDDTPEGAFAGIRDVVAFAVNSLQEDGDPIRSRYPHDDSVVPSPSVFPPRPIVPWQWMQPKQASA